MITIIGSWEEEWFSDLEKGLEVELILWHQLCHAYQVDRLIFTPKLVSDRLSLDQYDTVQEALDSVGDSRLVFCEAPHESITPIFLPDYQHPENATYVFGSPRVCNHKFGHLGDIVTIPTPKGTDMFGCTVVGQILYDRFCKNKWQ